MRGRGEQTSAICCLERRILIAFRPLERRFMFLRTTLGVLPSLASLRSSSVRIPLASKILRKLYPLEKDFSRVEIGEGRAEEY